MTIDIIRSSFPGLIIPHRFMCVVLARTERFRQVSIPSAFSLLYKTSRSFRDCVRKFSQSFSPRMQMDTATIDTEKGVLREGRAILAAGVSTDKVFYNPIQEFNRDLR